MINENDLQGAMSQDSIFFPSRLLNIIKLLIRGILKRDCLSK